MRRRHLLLGGSAAVAGAPAIVRAQDRLAFRLPLLVPLTGFVALEGKSQRDGALLAIRETRTRFVPEIIDTGTSPEGAATAWQRAFRDKEARDRRARRDRSEPTSRDSLVGAPRPAGPQPRDGLRCAKH